MPSLKGKAGGAAEVTPYTEITVARTASSGTPSSVLDGATFDAGLFNGFVVGNPEGHFTSAVDDGSTQDLVLAQDNLGDGDWGQAQDPTQKGVFLRYPDLIAGAFSADVAFEIAPNGGNWTFGLAIFGKEPTSATDMPYAYSGFGRTGSSTLVAPRATLYGINSSTESSTDANISCGAGLTLTAHLEVDADGKIHMSYTPDGGSKTEHGAPSNDYINTVGGPFYVAVVGYANHASGETFKVSSFNLTANSTAQSKGIQTLALLDFTSLGSADWTSGSDGDTFVVSGKTVAVDNIANATTMGPNGTTGVVIDPAVGASALGPAQSWPGFLLKATEFWSDSTEWPMAVFAVVKFAAGDPGANGDSSVGVGWSNALMGSASYTTVHWAGHATADEVFTRRGYSGGTADGTHYTLTPDWLGVVPSRQTIAAYGNTGSPASVPASGDRIAMGVAWGLSGTVGEMPGTFQLDGTQGLWVGAEAITGAWTTPLVIESITIYGVVS